MEYISIAIAFYIQTNADEVIDQAPEKLPAVRFEGMGETRDQAVLDAFGKVTAFLNNLPEGTTLVEYPKEDYHHMTYFIKYAELF